MSHKCQALIIGCMDYRFRTDLREFLVSLSLKNNYDMVSLAGATKGLVDRDPASSELILKQIDIASRLHGISEVYLVHHMDCGAYGGHAAFTDLSAERKRQIDDLATASILIKEKFPQLAIKKILARIEEINDDNKVDFEVIG